MKYLWWIVGLIVGGLAWFLANQAVAVRAVSATIVGFDGDVTGFPTIKLILKMRVSNPTDTNITVKGIFGKLAIRWGTGVPFTLDGTIEAYSQITLNKNSATTIDVPVYISAINLLTQAQNIKNIITNPIPGSIKITNLVIKTSAGNAPINDLTF